MSERCDHLKMASVGHTSCTTPKLVAMLAKPWHLYGRWLEEQRIFATQTGRSFCVLEIPSKKQLDYWTTPVVGAEG